MRDKYAGLSPADRLEAQRNDKLEKVADQSARMNVMIRLAARNAEDALIIRGNVGRPAWSFELFDLRWRRALRRGDLPHDAGPAAVAPYFEALDWTIGTLNVDYLRRLAKRARNGDLKSVHTR